MSIGIMGKIPLYIKVYHSYAATRRKIEYVPSALTLARGVKRNARGLYPLVDNNINTAPRDRLPGGFARMARAYPGK